MVLESEEKAPARKPVWMAVRITRKKSDRFAGAAKGYRTSGTSNILVSLFRPGFQIEAQ
jgi:hypothetical protein